MTEEDHPRGCGENFGLDFIGVCREGSPPRMRGKPGFELDNIASSGITPADAGKTLLGILLGVRAGSPPRMRGKHEA